MSSSEKRWKRRTNSGILKFWQSSEDFHRAQQQQQQSVSGGSLRVSRPRSATGGAGGRTTLESTVLELPAPGAGAACELALLEDRVGRLEARLADCRTQREAWHADFQQQYDQERASLRDLKKELTDLLVSISAASKAHAAPDCQAPAAGDVNTPWLSALDALTSELDPDCLL